MATARPGQGQVSGLPGVEHAPNRPISRGLELAEVSPFGGIAKGWQRMKGGPQRARPVTPDIAAEAQQQWDSCRLRCM